MVLRDFVARAEAYGIDYNIIEAFDQPWKTIEGGVGPYWGLFDASRNAEVLLDRADHAIPITGRSPGSRSLLGLLLSLPILAQAARDRRRGGHARRRRQRGRRLVRRSCSPSGTATTSCPAPPSRSALGVAAADPAGR